MDKKDTIPIISLAILLIITIYTGINPAGRLPWLLESGIVWIFALILVFTYKKIRFSNYVYVLLLIFLILPILGGFYSFDQVPYGELLDFSGNGTNHYDRFVHVMFGLLVTPFLFELIKKTTAIKKGVWLYLLPIALVLAGGAIYELTEWSSALVLAPDTVETWVGTKGDQWDSQKDMLLGAIGSIVSTAIIIFTRKKL